MAVYLCMYVCMYVCNRSNQIMRSLRSSCKNTKLLLAYDYVRRALCSRRPRKHAESSAAYAKWESKQMNQDDKDEPFYYRLVIVCW